MATRAQWIEGARLRTLPAAISPVIAGTGAAAAASGAHLGRALLALVVSLALQVGVNFANDYSDGLRGTDDFRVGPHRLTGSGATTPKRVKAAAFSCFAIAALFGAILIVISGQWWLFIVGLACFIGAWTYTGGSNPYGYRGLGEIGVFIFFGLVAVCGTTLTQCGSITWISVLCAVAIGLLACAILMSNNIRDIDTDTQAQKRTLAVRLGDRRARVAYVGMLVLSFLVVIPICLTHPWAWIVMLAAVPAFGASRRTLKGASGKSLIAVLKTTGLIELSFSILIAIGLAL